MQHLDEGTIHAWLDGALAPNEASASEAHVATCEQCARAVAEARGLIAASSRILGALDEVPAVQGSTGALSLPLTRTSRRSRLRRGGLGYAVAATALLAVGTTLVWSRMSPDSAMDARVTAASEAAPAPVAAASQIGDSVASKRAAESRPPAADLARDAVANAKNVVPTVTSAKLSEKKQQAQKEEDLAIDRVVPLPADVAASSRPAQVLGRVLDAATGAPVAGAIVSMDTAHVSARTDSAGKFHLQPVPLGNQTVSVRALGYQQAQHPVAVAASDTVQLAFALQKSALALQQVVVTGAAASAQQDRRDAQGAPREAERSKAVGQEGARLSRPSSRAESVAGCYTLSRVSQDKARDEDRALAASLPTRVQLESELVDRSRANESSPNRARTLTGNARAESWRMVGDSLEITVVDGDRRHALRFARRDTHWTSDIATLEPCSAR
jgi:anti-sigma factor RsiW